jgi:hypothetical protein
MKNDSRPISRAEAREIALGIYRRRMAGWILTADARFRESLEVRVNPDDPSKLDFQFAAEPLDDRPIPGGHEE